jgi:WS/DGAT/MGAT family acyltransferase
MWYVEGLDDGRFAIISKMHHCMIDGMSGADLLATLMSVDPREAEEVADRRWIPRPAPSARELFWNELWRRGGLPLRIVPELVQALGHPRRALHSAVDAIEALAQFVAVTPASATPLNPEIGPHRRFDWTVLDLETVRAIKTQAGGTINDVVLAIVTGAVRRFLHGRGVDVADLDFRSMVPVSTRTAGQRDTLGNRIVTLFAQLPLAERDPLRRLHLVSEATRSLKSSKRVHGGEVLEEISDATFTSLLFQFARIAVRTRPYNLVVTNVPGPSFPVSLLGAQMQEIYPLVPLAANQALGVALFSYNGGLFWGFNADWDAVPDLHDFVRAVEKELEKLHRAALALPREVGPSPAAKPRRRRRPERQRVNGTAVAAVH